MYCSHCGTELTEKPIAGRPRLACGACGQVVYRQLKVGAGTLVERERALLLVRRRADDDAFPGTWNLPAGYCEADEAPAAAAVRETWEETGLRVRAGRLVDAYFFDDDLRGHGLLLVYEAQEVGGELTGEGDEVAGVAFFPPEQVPEHLCGGGHDRAIGAWRDRALDRWQPGTPMRHCPHCAHPLEEKLAFDRLRPVCTACGFVHFRGPKVGVSVLVEQAGRALLVRRAIEPGLGKWCLPAGFVEWDEAPETAARRECLEETGLRLEELELLGARHYTDDYRGPGINLTYCGRAGGGRLQAGDDAAEVRFFAPADLAPLDEIAFRGHRRILEHWLAGQDPCNAR